MVGNREKHHYKKLFAMMIDNDKSDKNDAMDISMLSHVLVGMQTSSSSISSSNGSLNNGNNADKKLKEKVESLQIEIKDKDAVIDEYEMKLTSKSNELKQNEEEIKKYKQEMNGYKEEMNSMKERVLFLESTYESKAQCFVQELSKKTNEIHEKENEINEKDSEIIKFENEIKDLKSKLDFFKNRVSKMGKIEIAKSKFMRLNADYKQLKKTISFEFEKTKQEYAAVANTITNGLPLIFKHGFNNSISNSFDILNKTSSNNQKKIISDVETIKNERDILKSNLSELNKSYQKEEIT